jgi:UDP-N-acetylglucosamine acyltransferase
LASLIHPTAIIHPKAELHPTVRVDAYAVIGEKVIIGADTTIGTHAIVEGPTEIGQGNRIFASAIIGMEPQDLKYQGAASWVKIGDRNIFREYVTVNRATGEGEKTVIGNDNLLMAYTHVGHNCVIEDETIIANAAALGGHVHIESKARIGGVVGVHQFVRIGTLSMIGGVARIVRDVPPYTTVEGNPALVRSLNLVGLQRAGLNAKEITDLKKAYRILYRSNNIFQEAVDQLSSFSHNQYVSYLYEFLQASLSGKGRRGPIPGK